MSKLVCFYRSSMILYMKLKTQISVTSVSISVQQHEQCDICAIVLCAFWQCSTFVNKGILYWQHKKNNAQLHKKQNKNLILSISHSWILNQTVARNISVLGQHHVKAALKVNRLWCVPKKWPEHRRWLKAKYGKKPMQVSFLLMVIIIGMWLFTLRQTCKLRKKAETPVFIDLVSTTKYRDRASRWYKTRASLWLNSSAMCGS